MSTEEEQELIASWFTVIGMLTMFWTPAERFVDQCVHMLYSIKGLSENKKKPFKLGQKLQEISRHIPASIISAKEFDDLVNQTKEVAKTRNILVHGNIESFDNDQMVISKVDSNSKQHLLVNHTFNFKRLNQPAQELETIREKWGHLANELLKQYQAG